MTDIWMPEAIKALMKFRPDAELPRGIAVPPRRTPSRAFLVHQSVLNALDIERREYGFHGTVQAYARQRFGCLPPERWSGVYGFAQMVRTCFRTLAAQYGETL